MYNTKLAWHCSLYNVHPLQAHSNIDQILILANIKCHSQTCKVEAIPSDINPNLKTSFLYNFYNFHL